MLSSSSSLLLFLLFLLLLLMLLLSAFGASAHFARARMPVVAATAAGLAEAVHGFATRSRLLRQQHCLGEAATELG